MAGEATSPMPARDARETSKPDDLTHPPAIVIIAFNRPNALNRLLGSLSRADYGGCSTVPLIISVDKSDSDEVLRCAEAYSWTHGEKTIIRHAENIGLKRHLLNCGALTDRYGSVIILEDDLFVSPRFYRYARQAMEFYAQDDRIAGISLYSYDYNELAQLPFHALDDGYDNYFMKAPSSWGQLWTRRQWREFSRFHESKEAPLAASDPLSDIIITQWFEPSWKKYFYKYLLVKDKYFVYPRTSCTTNFSSAGIHFPVASDSYQVSLELTSREPVFSALEDSLSRYDAYFELLPEIIKAFNPRLAAYDFDCDLYGTRELHKTGKPFLLSAKPCASPVASFSASMTPHEANVCYGIPGDYFHLGETRLFSPMDPLKTAAHGYYSKIHRVNVPKIRADSFNEGVAAVRTSLSYRIGHALLWPAKMAKSLLLLLFK